MGHCSVSLARRQERCVILQSDPEHHGDVFVAELC